MNPGRLSPACERSGASPSPTPGGDVRAEVPAPRAAGQLLPASPRGNQFGTILAQRPFVFTGGRRNSRRWTARADDVARGRRARRACRCASRRPRGRTAALLVRWFEPAARQQRRWGHARARSSCASTGAAGLHARFDRSRSDVTDPDLAPRFQSAASRRSGAARTSSRSASARRTCPTRSASAIALQSASTTASDPALSPRRQRGATPMGTENSGFEWPSGQPAPLFDPGTGPSRLTAIVATAAWPATGPTSSSPRRRRAARDDDRRGASPSSAAASSAACARTCRKTREALQRRGPGDAVRGRRSTRRRGSAWRRR